jgi:hypothetical protein
VLTRWIVALSRYHNILKAEDAWVIDYDSAGPNDAKPTKSALRLKDLLETITGISFSSIPDLIYIVYNLMYHT